MAIGSGVLLPGVAENPTFPILRALAYYTTGLGYRPTCDNYSLALRLKIMLQNSFCLKILQLIKCNMVTAAILSRNSVAIGLLLAYKTKTKIIRP